MLQLANNYNPQKEYPTSSWLVSPKLDGVRCVYKPDEGLFSRSGKTKYLGFNAIESFCDFICRDKRLLFVDGELYIPGEPFDVISGIARKSKNFDPVQKARVEFRVFAIVFADRSQEPTANVMVDLIESYIPSGNRAIAVIQRSIPNNPLSIQQELDATRTSGQSQEGIMLRNPNSIYAPGRSDSLLKVKNFTRSTLVCTGYTRGTGKFAGMLGAINVELASDRRVTGRLGTGLTDSERRDIWQNQIDYLGRSLEGIHLGITPGGKLRHPVFVGFI
ncbi:MAG: hypothetical protein MUE44_08060 [Oscillatoriaceae cyanobacterium Prado104]|jgi:ATP-dependent DNA ligase|nr:hypothetical protein [Oscillatoriaceae cyanobacterium Prado104]